jgi:hypothetical protein
MNSLIKLEELAKMFYAYWLSIQIGYAWWVFLAWLLAPDLSMIGYLVNTKIGAWLYNLVHHQALAIGVGILGFYLGNTSLEFAGILLFGHSAMDRAFGYGLKYEDNFKHTHLGWIGTK